MRAITSVLFVAMLGVGTWNAAPAAAGDFSLGASLADFDDLGFQARWQRPFLLAATDLSTGVTYFVDGSYLAFDGDLHFHLADESWRNLYPLVGLRLATDFDVTNLDLNLGAGYRLMLGSRTTAALEGKFVIGDADDFVLTFSVFF